MSRNKSNLILIFLSWSLLSLTGCFSNKNSQNSKKETGLSEQKGGSETSSGHPTNPEGSNKDKSTASILEPSFKGGTLRTRLSSWPKGLNYFTANGAGIGRVWYFTRITLMSMNLETFEPRPFLAESWEESPDHKTLTFRLNKDAVWPDGKPITAEDVKFTFDLIWDPKRCVLCEPQRNFYGAIEETKAVDAHTFELKVKAPHFEKMSRMGEIPILAKHFYEKGNFDKDFDRKIFGGGPYNFVKSEFKMRKQIVLKRRKSYWANKYPHIRDSFNHNKIIFKYVDDANVAFEMFKRKEFDFFYYEIDSFNFLENKNSAPFTDENHRLIEAPRYNPWVWDGVALNMRKGPLKDKNFRNAIHYAFNREFIAKKIFKDKLVLITGPFNMGSKYSSKTPVESFDLKRSAEFLKKAGFNQADSDGILFREVDESGENKKERAEVIINYSRESHERWITVWKEGAKKVGINLVPRFVDWTTMQKSLDKFNFEAFVISWFGNPAPAPEQFFHGRSANNEGSSNYSGIDHKRLSELIDKGQVEFDAEKRYAIYHEIEKILIDEKPYIFRWAYKTHHVSYWADRLNPTDKPFKKFSGDDKRYPFHLHWKASNDQ